MRPSVVLSILALLLGSAVACGEPHPRPRLVILYATCTLNQDYLSPYSASVEYTPHLERLARRSTVFMSHRTESAQSGIAYASIFSGLQAPGHGVFSHPREIPEPVELITETFAANGYDTYSYLQHPMAGRALGYAQGVPPGQAFDLRLGVRDRTLRRVLDRLVQDPEYRAFIVTNFTVTHAPYSTERLLRFCSDNREQCTMDPETFAQMASIHERDQYLGYDLRRAARRGLTESGIAEFAAALDVLYRSNVHHLDQIVGALLGALDERALLDSTLIAFTADHGETLYREQALYSWGHGYQLSPDALNAPFILHAPGLVPAGARYSGVSRSIDVFPTLAALAGIELPPLPGRGIDLSPALRGEERAPDLLAFSHSSVLSKPVARGRAKRLDFFRSHFPRRDPELMWVAVKKADRVYKLRRFNEGRFVPAAFDTAEDPGELVDRYDRADPEQAAMIERLQQYRTGLVESFGVWKSMGSELPRAEQEERLRSLGYIE